MMVGIIRGALSKSMKLQTRPVIKKRSLFLIEISIEMSSNQKNAIAVNCVPSRIANPQCLAKGSKVRNKELVANALAIVIDNDIQIAID